MMTTRHLFPRPWLNVALLLVGSALSGLGVEKAPGATQAFQPAGLDRVRVVQLVTVEPLQRAYPDGLASLLTTLAAETHTAIDPEPEIIRSFDDPRLLTATAVYCNVYDRADWTLTEGEIQALRAYLRRGGFLHLDGGISAAFLRGENARFGQSHSFAEWSVAPEIAELFRQVIPEASFTPLPRTDTVFRMFYAGLPDPGDLPESIRDYVVNEKWPQGTYSLLALPVEGRVAVIASPILAMGWGRNALGQWTTNISFRIREGAEGLSERLAQATNLGTRFETTREDGRTDVIYTQQAATPAWVKEPDGRFRVFNYYHSREINEYAHRYYTQLGVNLFLYALTH